MRNLLVRWLICRDNWWTTPTRPARHPWQTRPGIEGPIYHCPRCDRRIGF